MAERCPTATEATPAWYSKNTLRLGGLLLTAVSFVGLTGTDGGCGVGIDTGNTAATSGSCKGEKTSYGAPRERFIGEFNHLPHNICPAKAKAIAEPLVIAKWHSEAEWEAFEWLINAESSWYPDAVNNDSGDGGACGLVQSDPCYKLESKSRLAGDGDVVNVTEQIDWGIAYVKEAYGDPLTAKAYHISHNSY